MNKPFIYTDMCSEEVEHKLSLDFNIDIVRRMPDDKWNVNDTMGIITIPHLALAVINRLDSISLMEISLLHFMCKPILVTTETINSYPAVSNTVDYMDGQCNLTQPHNLFLTWFSAWKDGRWK